MPTLRPLASALPALVACALLLAWLRDGSPAYSVPVNDNRAGAIAITTPVPSGLAATGNNTGATLETGAGEWDVYGGCQGFYYPGGIKTYVPNTTFDKTIWYKWTSPASGGTIVMDTYGSVVDTTLGVWTGATYGTQVGQTCSDAHLVADRSALVLTYVASTTYYIQLGVWPGSPAGTIRLNLTTGAMMVVNTSANDQIPDTELSINQAARLARGTTAFAALTAGEADLVLEGSKAGVTGSDLIHFLPTTNYVIPGLVPTLTANSDHITGIAPKAVGYGVAVVASSFTCFTVTGNGNQISGMLVDNCGTGVDISGSSNLIGGSLDPILGNDFRGDSSSAFAILVSGPFNSARGNRIGVSGATDYGYDWGVRIAGAGADSNVIGGTSVADRNVISGNDVVGVEISGGADFNSVLGNFIGISEDGTTAVPNPLLGVSINSTGGAATNNVVRANVISGNGIGAGIFGEDADTNTISANTMGTAAFSLAAIPNNIAIDIAGGADYNTVGGAGTFDYNIIRANVAGVRITDDGTQNNSVIRNLLSFNLTAVYIGFGADNNIVGASLLGNEIFNGGTGVLIDGIGTTMNIVSGNIMQYNARGVELSSGTSGNIVGPATAGVHPDERNVIAGNTDGVWLDSLATANTVRGNWIGYTGGSSVLANTVGVRVTGGAYANTIGGSAAGEANVISGNLTDGITMNGAGTTINTVKGNLIGTDETGTIDLGNANGISIRLSAGGNSIGGSNPGDRNVISGNNGNGVIILGPVSATNEIRGNYIGTNSAGTGAVPNGTGILVADDSSGNDIGGPSASSRNVISGNALGVQITGTGTDNNRVRANYIGLAADGSSPLPNATGGVKLTDDASGNFIGGSVAGERNIIGSNGGAGVMMTGEFLPMPHDNLVQGNYIGTDATGTSARSNGIGVDVASSNRNTILGNLVSGNSSEGIRLFGSAQNEVQGNMIGTNAAGTAALPNTPGIRVTGPSSSNTIGGDAPSERNVISGNNAQGVRLASSGGAPAAYSGSGVAIPDPGTAGSPVLVSHAARVLDVNVTVNILHGQIHNLDIVLIAPGGSSVVLSANHGGVGTSYTNTTFDDSASTSIGSGSAPFTGSYIPDSPLSILNGISSYGTWTLQVTDDFVFDTGQLVNWTLSLVTEGNAVQGNYIGTDIAGAAGLANNGVGVEVNSDGNRIGGVNPGEGNVISANNNDGVVITGANNQIYRNLIGLGAGGMLALGNQGNGVNVEFGASFNSIGSGTVQGRNVISANVISGVYVAGNNNPTRGNYIGTAADGITARGNGDTGVALLGINNDVGGEGPDDWNRIAFNSAHGISASSGISSHTFFQNSIHSNGGLGIRIFSNAAAPPQLFFATVDDQAGTTTVLSALNGTPSTLYRVEFFTSWECDASGFGEGLSRLDPVDVMTDGFGYQLFSPTLNDQGPAGSVVTATATNLTTGDTTEFSNCIPAYDDADDDDDGYTDADEAGAPLCAAAVDDDSDGAINDGCPVVFAPEGNCANALDDDSDGAINDGCVQVTAFSEAQFKIGTGPADPCGANGWPSNLFDGGGSANKLTIQDVTSFVAPDRHFDTNPGDPFYNPRWDIRPGAGALPKFINIQDVLQLVAGPSGNPPMFGGGRAFGLTCPFPP